MLLTESVSSTVLSGVSFTTFRAEDVKRLSVKEITNAQTFDALGHVTSSGLHDPALGPAEMEDVCATCGQNGIHCPGHMGHITFPLPVYNPLFFRTLYTVLKATCFSCHRFLAQSERIIIAINQHKLLEYGLLEKADHLVQTCAAYLCEQDPKRTSMKSEESEERKKPSVESNQAVVSGLMKLIDQLVKDALKDVDKKRAVKASLLKNLIDIREQLRKEIQVMALVQLPRHCVHCQALRRPLRNEYNSKIFFTHKAPADERRKKRRAARDIGETYEADAVDEVETVVGDNDDDDDSDHDDDDDDDDERGVAAKKKATPATERQKLLSNLKEQVYLTPLQAREHLRALWEFDECRQVLQQIFGALSQKCAGCPTDVFFLEVMPVPPTRFRPVQMLKGGKYENMQTANLSKALKSAQAVCDVINYMQKERENLGQTGEREGIPVQIAAIPGQTNTEKLHNSWIRLQTSVNGIVDSSLDKLSQKKHPGIKQLLEKKEGLFRKHMMGKRVDYAARSVISPDPYINMDEVGIPEVFATKLTYPEPVTPRNAAELSRAVINGPDVHPGASFIEQEDGTKIKLSNKSRVQREAMAKQLLKPTDASKCVLGRKKVYRHLRNGDVLLLNRQPTLHRPSIQAHKARVLRGEKTLRLHYANCKAYNADFDGDEMNAHFPQNEVARAEAYYIVNTAHSYLVPKDGTPLAGLIQDHVIAGVLLSIRGRFFLRSDYQHLVYSGLTENHNPIKLLPPAIRKPHVLWSGKQVISTVLLNLIPKNKPPLNLVGKAKIGAKSWISTANPRPWAPGGKPLEPDELSESAVIFRDGELLCGVLDKAHYGPTPYGLVHCCYEIYGPDMASKLLTSLARVFTTFLQLRGFTLGVEDILVTKKADKKRRRIAEASTLCGPDVAARAFGLSEKPKTSKVEHKFRLAQFNKEEGPLKELDLCMKSRTDEFQNEIAKACMPYGLHKSFPSNNLQLMVQSGAKGSSVNTMQISCLLGQIELEGRRPPLMCTGRALPSFLAYDTSPRSGGFISGRFLTGIRPQEYFFHCMAGREGLVDTAVKTSRSGYLQRCIIKHLEGLLVAYDLTVRDSDGSVVQFQYGEDSLDILNTPFLTSKQIPFLVRNHGCLMADGDVEKLEKVLDTTSVKKPKRKTMKYVRKYGGEQRPRDSPFLKFCEDVSVAPSSGVSEHGRLPAAVDALKKWRTLDDSDKSKYKKRVVPEPVTSRYRPDRYLGSMSENHQKMVDEYAKSEANLLLGKHEDMTPSKSRDHISRARYDWLMNVKHMRALVEPGQAVGLLAAQSIGEPSTQMTLNTFHFAGRGEMNVTLGIPRLREILMTASQTLKTPAMEVPVLPEAKSKRVKQLQLKLTSVTLDKVLAKTLVTETTIIRGSAKHRLYRIRLEYLPYEQYKDKYILTPEKINKYVERKFLRRLDESVRKLLTGMNVKKSLYSSKVVTRVAVADELAEAEMAGDQADVEDEIDDDDQNDGDTTADKNRRRQQDDVDYEGEEEERGEVGAQSASESESNDFDSDEAEEDDDDDEEAEDEEEDDLNMSVREKKKKRKSLVAMDGIRVNAALQSCSLAVKYEYDAEEELWAEVTLELPLTSGSKFDMTTVLEIVARRAVVWETSQIKRCFLSQNKMAVDQTTILKTEGVNLQELHRHDKLLDLKQIHSNDVHAIANVYGIEAAARAIVKELRTVFAAYGIDVNYRHLSLIADYMTFEGHYKPFNRMAMESNASPLQKMTFETAMHFIKTATISGAQDNLQSPSSRLVVGQPVYSGTGCFDLIQPLAQTS